jgi:hypothetical protein
MLTGGKFHGFLTDTKWRCAVFILQPFYLPEEPPVPTGYEAERTQNQSGHIDGKNKKPTGNRTIIVQLIATLLTELPLIIFTAKYSGSFMQTNK